MKRTTMMQSAASILISAVLGYTTTAGGAGTELVTYDVSGSYVRSVACTGNPPTFFDARAKLD